MGKALIEKYSGVFAGPRISSIGAFSYTKSYFPPQFLTIGRYCAIAERCSLMQTNHPIDRLSSCGFDYASSARYGNYEKDLNISVDKKVLIIIKG